jgi:hypothetical protein
VVTFNAAVALRTCPQATQSRLVKVTINTHHLATTVLRQKTAAAFEFLAFGGMSNNRGFSVNVKYVNIRMYPAVIMKRNTCHLSLTNTNDSRKRDILLGTWNVRSLYRAGSLTAAARNLARYKLDSVWVQDVMLDKEGQ